MKSDFFEPYIYNNQGQTLFYYFNFITPLVLIIDRGCKIQFLQLQVFHVFSVYFVDL